MKTKRFFSIVAMLMLAVFTAVAQTKDEVTLTVSGDGATKEEATKNALRDAIGQAFGTFVSSNSQLLNDELVKDEVVNITSGNVKSYKEISSFIQQNKTVVTLQATVCISKLVSYAKSKGSSAELAGATFAINMKIKELNKKNELVAIQNLFGQLAELPNPFNFRLNLETPRIAKQNEVPNKNVAYYAIDATVDLLATKNLNVFNEVAFNTLLSLCLDQAEKEEYIHIGMPIYCYSFPSSRERRVVNMDNPYVKFQDFSFALRNEFTSKALGEAVSSKSYSDLLNYHITEGLIFLLEDFATSWVLKDNMSNPSNLKVSHIEIDMDYMFRKEAYRWVRTEGKHINPWIYKTQAAYEGVHLPERLNPKASGEYTKEMIPAGTTVGKLTFTIYIPQAEISKYTSITIVPTT